ncbi:expressed protein, partial [Phakopsora pachyrhizi]
MIDAYFRAPMPHEENLNEKNFFGSLFDKNILRREAVESFNEKKMPSHSTGEIDYPQKSLFCSSINKDDSECSKSQETERLLKYKRKYYTYESKSVGARELNSEVAEIFGAEGGSIDQKFRLKSQLDGLVGTSNANLETVDEEIKMKLDEPEKTYKLLKSKNEKTLVEYETFNQASQIYSFQPRAAWENVRNKAEDNVSKTGYFIDANSEYPKTGLEFLMNVLFKQLKLQEHNELTSLDNFIEGIYRRAKSRLHPDYVLGSLIDWNLGKSIEERVNYFVECDEELKKQRKRTGKMKTLDRNYSNNINKAIFKEASKKIKSFWNSYYEKFRHNYLPLSKGTQNYDYKLLIREIGVLRGENHLEKLSMGKNIKQALERISSSQKKKPKNRYEASTFKSKYQIAKNTIIMVSNYIVILYRIFTPFDNKTIDEMRINLAMAIENLVDFWVYFFAVGCNKIYPKDAHKINPFMKGNIINQLSNNFLSKTIHFKRYTISASRIFFWNWISDSDGINFQFIDESLNQKFMAQILNFI